MIVTSEETCKQNQQHWQKFTINIFSLTVYNRCRHNLYCSDKHWRNLHSFSWWIWNLNIFWRLNYHLKLASAQSLKTRNFCCRINNSSPFPSFFTNGSAFVSTIIGIPSSITSSLIEELCDSPTESRLIWEIKSSFASNSLGAKVLEIGIASICPFHLLRVLQLTVGLIGGTNPRFRPIRFLTFVSKSKTVVVKNKP